jgi:GntR family transcriptional regulator
MRILQNSEEPIYQQIAAQFRGQILSGTIQEGSYLPSIRGLAQDLKISVITTMKAYETLAGEGLVTAVQGKGFLVNAQNRELVKEQHLRQVEENLQKAITSARIAGLTDDELVEMLRTLISVSREGV